MIYLHIIYFIVNFWPGFCLRHQSNTVFGVALWSWIRYCWCVTDSVCLPNGGVNTKTSYVAWHT